MRILYGPLPEVGMKPFSGKITAALHIDSGGAQQQNSDGDTEIVSFSISDAGHHFMTSIYAHLPEGWYPDVCVFTYPEYNVIPIGLEELPCPIVALIGDWYIIYPILIENIERFDYIFTVQPFVPFLEARGYTRYQTFPIFARDLSLFRRLPDIERQYDVVFVGNLRTSIHTERAYYLRRLASLGHQYAVHITTKVYDEDYVRLLNQAKIVFNYTIQGEFNQRCFEALGCGALLMVEEHNQEITQYLTPQQEFITYNSQNFESQIHYYLHAEQERDTIAEAGYQAIQNWDIPKVWERLIGEIKTRIQQDKMIRVRPFTKHAQALKTFWSVVPPHNHLNQATLEFLEALSHNRTPLVLNDFAVLYYASYLNAENHQPNHPEHFYLLHHAKHFLLEAIDLLPNYFVAIHNLAIIFQTLKLEDEAFRYWDMLHKARYKDDLVPAVYQGLLAFSTLHQTFTRYFHPLYMQWQRSYYIELSDSQAQFVFNLIKVQALAALMELKNDSKYLFLSASAYPELTDLNQWIVKLYQNRDFESCLKWILRNEADPLQPNLWLIHCSCLQALGRQQEAELWAWYYGQLLASCPGLEQTEIRAQLKARHQNQSKERALMHYFQKLSLHPKQPYTLFFGSYQIDWHPPFPEADLPDEIQLVFGMNTQTKGVRIHISEDKKVPYFRNHKIQKIGVSSHYIPFQFPRVEGNGNKDLMAEIQAISGLKLAVLYSDKSIPMLRTLIHTQTSLVVILWKTAFSDAEIEALETELTAEEQECLLLWETENTEDMAALFKQSDLNIFADPENQAFYLWWSLYLGQACYIAPIEAQLLNPYPIDSQSLKPLIGQFDQQGFKRCFESLAQFQAQAQKIATELKAFYSTEANRQIIRALWRLQETAISS